MRRCDLTALSLVVRLSGNRSPKISGSRKHRPRGRCFFCWCVCNFCGLCRHSFVPPRCLGTHLQVRSATFLLVAACYALKTRPNPTHFALQVTEFQKLPKIDIYSLNIPVPLFYNPGRFGGPASSNESLSICIRCLLGCCCRFR